MFSLSQRKNLPTVDHNFRIDPGQINFCIEMEKSPPDRINMVSFNPLGPVSRSSLPELSARFVEPPFTAIFTFFSLVRGSKSQISRVTFLESDFMWTATLHLFCHQRSPWRKEDKVWLSECFEFVQFTQPSHTPFLHFNEYIYIVVKDGSVVGYPCPSTITHCLPFFMPVRLLVSQF